MAIDASGATVRRDASVPVIGAVVMVLAVMATAGLFDSLLTPWLLVASGVVCTLTVRPRSVIAFWHLAQVTALFAVTGALFGTGTPRAQGVVLAWMLAITATLLLLRMRPRPVAEEPEHTIPLTWWHIVGGVGLVAAQFWFYRSNVGGIAGQLEGGVTGGSGVAAVVLALAPLWILMLGVGLIRNRTGRIAISILFLAETLVLSQSGFRGASVNYLLSAVILANLLLPLGSRWRSWRAIPAIVAFGALAFVGFNAGAAVKSQAVASHNFGSDGTSSASLETLTILAKRLDLMDPLSVGVDAASRPGVSDALSWKNSALSVVPRALYPDKPEFRYGQTVSVVVYGTSPLTSSTISFLGDIYCNFGSVGVSVLACLAGIAAWWAERAKFTARGTFEVGGAVIGAASITSLESQIPLALAGAIRGYLFLCAGWLLLELARPRARQQVTHQWRSLRRS